MGGKVPQGTIYSLLEDGSSGEMKINIGKLRQGEISRQPFRKTDYDRSKSTADVEYLKYLGCLAINSARYIHEIKFRSAKAKTARRRPF